jgi:hypothetical protein
LVGLCEAHLLQEEHDFFGALLRQRTLPSLINDIVVEFGNALYQPIADRFILGDEPVANAVLHQIWRNTTISGGNPGWDAPVYEQFFRTVRAVNWSLPPSRRIRVLLGDPLLTGAKCAAPRTFLPPSPSCFPATPTTRRSSSVRYWPGGIGHC